MSKVIAVLGAGPGFGEAVARRFGRAGFRVALVARRAARLDELVGRLAAEGIEAAGFPADLSRPADVPALIDRIRDRFGRIDVVEYGPLGSDQALVPAVRVDAELLANAVPMFLLTPVEVVRAVLPEWTERGDGAFLMTTGVSSVHAVPGLSGLPPVGAAARNYLVALHAELGGSGVYAGTLSVAAGIARSDLAVPSDPPAGGAGSFPVVDPDELAEQYWDMYTRRDGVERIHPPL